MGMLKEYTDSEMSLIRNMMERIGRLPYIEPKNFDEPVSSQTAKIWLYYEKEMGLDVDMLTIAIGYRRAIVGLAIMDDVIKMANSALNDPGLNPAKKKELQNAIFNISAAISEMKICDDRTVNKVYCSSLISNCHQYLRGKNIDLVKRMYDAAESCYEPLMNLRNNIEQASDANYIADMLSEELFGIVNTMWCYFRDTIAAAFATSLVNATKMNRGDKIYDALRATTKDVGKNKKEEWINIQANIATLYALGYPVSIAQFMFLSTIPIAEDEEDK